MRHRLHILTGLILIGIIAIVASLVVRYGLPYLHEKRLEMLDTQRVADIDLLDNLIRQAVANPENMHGENNTVYISLPSGSPTCNDYELTPLPEGWKYHCVLEENLTKTDGTGWIPINFNQYTTYRTFRQLPVDPLNNVKELEFYAFVQNTNEHSQYLLMTRHVRKWSKKQTPIPGTLWSMSRGSNLSLGLNANSISMYLPFTKSYDDSLTIDLVNPSQIIDIPQGGLISQENCFLKTCLSNSDSEVVLIPIPSSSNTVNTAVSYGLTFRGTGTPQKNFRLFNLGADRIDINFEGISGSMFSWFYTSEPHGYLVYKSLPNQFIDGKWHRVILTKKENIIKIFIDGRRIGKLTAPTNEVNQILKTGSIELAEGFSLNEVIVYSRSLTEAEAISLSRLPTFQ